MLPRHVTICSHSKQQVKKKITADSSAHIFLKNESQCRGGLWAVGWTFQGSILVRSKRLFFSSELPYGFWGPPSLLLDVYREDFLLAIKWQESEVDP